MPHPPKIKVNYKPLFFILGGVSLFVMVSIVVIVIIVWLPMKSYISEKPFAIEHVPQSQEREVKVKKEMGDFFRQKEIDRLVLDEADINHLVRTSPKIQNYKVQYRIRVQDSLLNIRCSVPASVVRNQLASIIKYLNVEGFINAEVEGKIRYAEGSLIFVPMRSQMNGRDAPFGILGKRTHIDLMEFVKDKQLSGKILKNLKSVQILDGRLIFSKK